MRENHRDSEDLGKSLSAAWNALTHPHSAQTNGRNVVAARFNFEGSFAAENGADYATALLLYRKAAEAGNTDAIQILKQFGL